MEIIKPIIDLFKFTPRHFASFAITSFIIFFIPTNIVKDIAPALYDYYRPVSGLIFILSISGLIVELSIFIANKIRIQFRIQKGKARLNSLTKEEKDILRRYISGDTRTQFFAVDNGAIAELASLGILITYVRTYHMMKGIPYGIADWALKYLKSNSHILKG